MNQLRDLGAVYCRLSQQTENEESVDRQVQNCSEYVRARGLTPVVFREPPGARSGYYENKRPEWLRLKRELENNPRFALVCVADLARASRHMRNGLEFIEFLVKKDIELVSLKEQIDPHSAVGKALLGMSLLMNEWYRNDISERKTNQVLSRDKTIYASNVHPFGITRTGHYPNIVWTTTNDFPVLVHILELYVDGLGVRTIANDLNARGVFWRDRHGQPTPLIHSTLTRAINAVDRYKPFLNPDLYERVIQVRDARRAAPRKYRTTKRPPLLLRGLLYCPFCNSAFRTGTQFSKRDYGEYEYRYYYHKANLCPPTTRRTRREDLIEQEFFKYLEPLQHWTEQDRKLTLSLLVNPPEQALALDVDAQRSKLKHRLESFELMRADGDITPARFREVKAQIEQEVAALPVVVRPRIGLTEKKAEAFVDDFLTIVREGALFQPKAVADLLRMMIAKIYFDGFRVTAIEWIPPFAAFAHALS